MTEASPRIKILGEQWISLVRVLAAEQVVEGNPSRDKEILLCRNMWELVENLHWQNDYQEIFDKRENLFESRFKIERLEKGTPLYNEILKLMPKRGDALTSKDAEDEWKAFKETQKTIRNGEWSTDYNKVFADKGPPSGTYTDEEAIREIAEVLAPT